MENQRVEAAIQDSDRWFRSAELQYAGKIYDKALYSLEMSLEIAMKAFFISCEMDFPKSHNIGDSFAGAVKRMGKMTPKGFRDNAAGIIDTFQALLNYRNASGYSFDGRIGQEEFRRKYEETLPGVEKARAEIMAAITSL